MRKVAAAVLLLTSFPAWSFADFIPVGVGAPSIHFDLAGDWCDTENPNGEWRYARRSGFL